MESPIMTAAPEVAPDAFLKTALSFNTNPYPGPLIDMPGTAVFVEGRTNHIESLPEGVILSFQYLITI